MVSSALEALHWGRTPHRQYVKLIVAYLKGRSTPGFTDKLQLVNVKINYDMEELVLNIVGMWSL